MAYHRMSEVEVREFLTAEPARPGVLGTTRKDGRPHLAPVWFVVDDDGGILFNTGADTVKGRTLKRTGYAALTVQDDRAPFSFVTVQGPVEIIEDLEEVRRWAAIIGGRYMGADRAEEYGARNGVPGEWLIRMTVTHTVSAADVAD
ncbi:MAG: PPOX class F420-dependent oxidoreductase [Propionibacteriaceae bacterium]|nr:PPOX class F420-dependent oxidoreductase [Propionibacteriaceae bacterium]